MQGPMVTLSPEGGNPVRAQSSRIPLGTMPDSVPFFPECRRAPAEPSRATIQTGAQSATEIPSVMPRVIVSRPSTPGIGFTEGSVTMEISAPWICSAVTKG